MSNFAKGFTYIVYSESFNHWYMVHQIGMRSWVATNFTNVDIADKLYSFRNNGKDLWLRLRPRKDYDAYTNNPKFREGMFNVLMYGSLKKKD